MLERDFQKELTTWFKKNDILYYKTDGGLKSFPNGHGGYTRYTSQPGFPDIIVFDQGQIILIELKTDKGRLRDTQKELFTKLADELIHVYILRPRYFEELKNNYEEVNSVYYAIEKAGVERFYSGMK